MMGSITNNSNKLNNKPKDSLTGYFDTNPTNVLPDPALTSDGMDSNSSGQNNTKLFKCLREHDDFN